MNRRSRNSKLRIPLGVGILTVGVVGLLAVAGLCSLTLRYGSFSFLESANKQSEYVTVHQYDLEATAVPTATPIPTEEPTPEPTPQPTSSVIRVSSYGTLQFGDDSISVKQLHERLMALGYMDYDEAETLYTVSTENAVKLFQRANDLEQTGIASSALQEMLFSDDAQPYRAKRNDDGVDVSDAQERLSVLGYYEDKISGYYGPQTELAVRLFQSKNSLPIDGEISRTTYGILYSDDVVWLATPTPTPTPTPSPTPDATPKNSSHSSRTAKATLRPGQTATPKPTATPKVTNKPGTELSSYGSGVSGMIACAEQQIGDPYVWGAKGPDSFDCSGLAYYCMKMAGASVSRSTAASYSEKSSWRKIESISDLKAGDLIFWKSDDSDKVSHVGICTGGSSFIHASSSKGCVCRSSIGSSEKNYWYRNFVCGRRVFG